MRVEAVIVEPFAFKLVDAEGGVVDAAESVSVLAVKATAGWARC